MRCKNYGSLGSQASTDHVPQVARESSLPAKGLKSHTEESEAKGILGPPPVLTREEADDVLILSGEKSTQQNGVTKQ